MPEWLQTLLTSQVVATVLQIALIVILTLLANALAGVAARRAEARWLRGTADAERQARMRTLIDTGRSTLTIAIVVIATLMVLYSLSINIAPLLAGAGVAGLAISLGAQTLIKDFIGGALILSENQFNVGDVIQVGDVSGVVEEITLRATYLRDLQGKLILVPNGDVRQVSNITRDWARAVVDLYVAFDADIGAVVQALERAAQRAQADDAIKSLMLEAPQVAGWSGFNEWGVLVRIMVKTSPGQQWTVETALRRCALDALHVANIRVALPGQDIRLNTPS
jgi:small-conductance mechanosensitive channel